MKIVCIGDIVGASGVQAFLQALPQIRNQYAPDVLIVNGENSAADGRGITPAICQELFSAGVDCITTGNHVWSKKEIIPFFDQERRLIRPLNFPGGAPGVGVTVVQSRGGRKVGVINAMGRVFMHEQLDCPFRAIQSALTFLKQQTSIIIVDFHTETTSEKAALGLFLDGQVSLVYGTHTHVQTADERILPKGTAFMTDLGMCGALNSAIGVIPETVIKRFTTQMPHKFAVATNPPFVVSGVCINVDEMTGKTLEIERIRCIIH